MEEVEHSPPALDEDDQDENKDKNAPFCIKSVALRMKHLTNDEESEDVELIHFVVVYEELCKFIGMLGKIFEFVEKDVRDKINVLRNLQKEDPESYETILTMINSEKPTKIKQSSSGSVAILHLNRALEFIVDFMNAATAATNEDSIPKICKECYDGTLAKHHPWIVRAAVKVAVYTLPSREKMLQYIKGNLTEETIVREHINIVVEHGKVVHSRIEAIYTTHNLHKIA